MTSEAEG